MLDHGQPTTPIDRAWAPARGGESRSNHLIGAVLAVLYLVVLVKTAHGIGYARDEGFYFRAASAYSDWFDLLASRRRAATSQSAVDATWSNNHEHPALVKSVFGISWNLFYKKLHFFSEEGTSFRFGGMCFAAGALWLIYIWGARARSRAAGLVAALLFALMPRVFYHAHLDCFDVPIACMWALCAYVYWRSLQTGTPRLGHCDRRHFRARARHQAQLLVPSGGAHGSRVHHLSRTHLARSQVRRDPSTARAVGDGVDRTVRLLGLWPWIWFDTVDRMTGYANFHLNHEYYNMIFLGVNYWKPPMPRGYAWLMTAATVPTITLLLFLTGVVQPSARASRAVVLAQRRPRHRTIPQGPTCCGVICLLMQYAPWLLSTNTPIFGGTKHWLTAYPFLCLFAGVGFDVVAGTRAAKLRRASRLARFARRARWLDGGRRGARGTARRRRCIRIPGGSRTIRRWWAVRRAPPRWASIGSSGVLRPAR